MTRYGLADCSSDKAPKPVDDRMLVKYEIETWQKPGYSDTTREVIERSLAQSDFVDDFGVDTILED